MGLFSMMMSLSIVVLQATLILSNRDPNLWVFVLQQHSNPHQLWTKIYNVSNTLTSNDPMLKAVNGTPFAHCILLEADNNMHDSKNKDCRLWYHSTQEISKAFGGATLNPHLLILVLASIHFIVCFSISQNRFYEREHGLVATKRKSAAATRIVSQSSHEEDLEVKNEEWDEKDVSSKIYHFPLGFTLLLLSLLCLIVGLIASGRNDQDSPLLDSPTLILCIILLISAGLFLYFRQNDTKGKIEEPNDDDRQFINTFADNMNSNHIHITTLDVANDSKKPFDSLYYPIWTLIVQLQMIGVPLTVLMISVMGDRFFTDIISHFIFLSVAVNSLWLQVHLQSAATNDWMLVLIRFLTCGIPLFCIFLSQMQWGGTNTWGQIYVFMAFFSLAPLYIVSFSPIIFFHPQSSTPGSGTWDKVLSRIGVFCTTVAIGSAVINLALV